MSNRVSMITPEGNPVTVPLKNVDRCIRRGWQKAEQKTKQPEPEPIVEQEQEITVEDNNDTDTTKDE